MLLTEGNDDGRDGTQVDKDEGLRDHRQNFGAARLQAGRQPRRPNAEAEWTDVEQTVNAEDSNERADDVSILCDVFPIRADRSSSQDHPDG